MSEKNNLTFNRLAQYNSSTEYLEKKWGKYCYVPLDIPKFENPEVANWFFERCKPIHKIKSDIAIQQVKYNYSMFNAVDVFDQEPLDGDYYIWEVNPQQDFFKLFPEFYEKIKKEFPFDIIGRLIFWQSTGEIMPHRDQTEFLDFPHSFRILLHDTNPEPTLSLIEHVPDTPDDFSNEFVLPRLDNTNSFVWNNLRTKHKSIYIPGNNKIIILILGHVNKDRYDDLMERSIRKFDQYTFKSNLTLDNWIKR